MAVFEAIAMQNACFGMNRFEIAVLGWPFWGGRFGVTFDDRFDLCSMHKSHGFPWKYYNT